MSGEPAWISYTAVAIAAVVLLLALVAWWKGRRFTDGDVFRASRMSSGNRIFPTQVLVTPTSVVQFTPRWIGQHEESIHMAHISSVKIDTGLLLSDIMIETSGGASPIRCHGHRKADAVRIKSLIEGHQSAYYQDGPKPPPSSPVGADELRR